MGRILIDSLYILVTLIFIGYCYLVKESLSDGEFVIALMLNYGLSRFLSTIDEFTIEEIKDNE